MEENRISPLKSYEVGFHVRNPTVLSSRTNFECSFIRTICYVPYCYGISQNW